MNEHERIAWREQMILDIAGTMWERYISMGKSKDVFKQKCYYLATTCGSFEKDCLPVCNEHFQQLDDIDLFKEYREINSIAQDYTTKSWDRLMLERMREEH